MKRFLVRRAVRTLIVLWGVSTVVFLIMRLSGDPVMLLVPEDAPAAVVERLRHEMGLDAPLAVQYVRFLGGALRGDFGQSIRFGDPAMTVVLERVAPTAQLALVTLIFAVVVATPVGIISALRPNTAADRSLMALALLGQSTPTFLLGIILIWIFAVQLRLLPTGGRGQWFQILMPAVALGAASMAAIARLMRSAVLEVLQKDFVRTARAKGVAESLIMLQHVLKNAAIPLVTIIGLQFGGLLAGAVVTETVFSWPGMGRLLIQAISSRDYPVVQAGVFLIAVSFVVINTVVDIAYAVLDPRIRYS
jgi:ABC-type dipeptide/oligopeptide/nickel transport system permease component